MADFKIRIEDHSGDVLRKLEQNKVKVLEACGQTARRETDSGTENSLREFRRELLRYMMMAFFGQTSAQVPQPTQASSSRTQVLAARSTVSAPAGHLRAQIVQ